MINMTESVCRLNFGKRRIVIVKSDARVKYTKRVLREALLKCMRTKSIKQITVKEVCDAAEINRATFYKHYYDCFDLLEQIENEMLEDYKLSLAEIDPLDSARLAAEILDMIEKNKDICNLLMENRLDESLIKKMLQLAHDRYIDVWRAQMKRASEDEVEMLFNCVATGILRVIIDGYGKYSHEAIIAFTERTVVSCMRPYVENNK